MTWFQHSDINNKEGVFVSVLTAAIKARITVLHSTTVDSTIVYVQYNCVQSVYRPSWQGVKYMADTEENHELFILMNYFS